jgi:hypothetical protein
VANQDKLKWIGPKKRLEQQSPYLAGNIRYCLDNLDLCDHWEQRFILAISSLPRLTIKQEWALDRITLQIAAHLRAKTAPNQVKLTPVWEALPYRQRNEDKPSTPECRNKLEASPGQSIHWASKTIGQVSSRNTGPDEMANYK